jgi:hypothetical protein
LKVVGAGVLPVLSGERARDFPDAFKVKTNEVYYWYLVRDRRKFLLTNPNTCLVQETTCIAKPTDKDKGTDQSKGKDKVENLKGWKSLVSDHYPVYVDIEM